ncbi:MAG: polysaccharide pyruvyl transferase family protein [Planctomycetota bacterium]
MNKRVQDFPLVSNRPEAAAPEKRLRRVVMCGPALNQSNTGDRLLVGTLTQILRRDIGVERVIYVSIGVEPRVEREIPGLEIINPRTQPWRLAWFTFRADAFIIAGAISFHEHKRVMLKQAMLAWLCRLGGGRTVINAVSIQPIRNWLCRLLFRATHAAANWFTVRDQDSVKHALAMGIRHPAQRSPDPGIMCPIAPAERVNQILSAEMVPTHQPLFCIAPHLFVNHGRYRDRRYAGFQIEYPDYSDTVLDEYHEALARIGDWLTDHGTVLFVPLCTKTPPGDDRLAAEWICRKMTHGNRAFRVNGEYTTGELAGILSRCTLLLSSRLHGYALGVANGVPSLAVEFHGKMRGLAEELGLVDWIFPMRNLYAESIRNTIVEILSDLPAARERVRVGVERAADKARSDVLRGVTGRFPPRAA